MKNNTLFVCVGLSGSGKSFYRRHRFLKDFPEVQEYLERNYLDIEDIVVCPDDIRRQELGSVSDQSNPVMIFKIVEQQIRLKLKEYNFCYYDALNITGKGRKILHDIKADKIAIVFRPDIELSKQRIANDIDFQVDRAKVPDEIIDKQYLNFTRCIIKNEKWNGEWSNKIKTDIRNNLKTEFDGVVFVD